MNARRRYPLPEQVGVYGDRVAFEKARPESGQWVFWTDRVELILDGRYEAVMPLHVELSPTYLCNFACPWCSCRSAREDWSDEDVFNHPDATEMTVMGETKLRLVIDHLAKHRIGIQWVGGEPTMNPLLYRMARRADAAGIKQCLFTNGSVLHPNRVEALFDSHFVFIRVSLDAVTEGIHQTHHGYRPERPYAKQVLDNLHQMVRLRRERGSATMIGVSVVVDERNIQDVVPTARHIRRLCEDHGAGAIDYAIYRPTYQFYNAQLQALPDTAARLAGLLGPGSEVEGILHEAGVRLIVPKDSFVPANAEASPEHGDACLAAGWFGEITPNGDMVVCSDRYGNPDYFIGNAASLSIEELWLGPRRRAVLSYAEQSSCFKTRCPRNGRGFALNRIFHEVERFRRTNRLDEVRAWINDLRAILPIPSHSFFL